MRFIARTHLLVTAMLLLATSSAHAVVIGQLGILDNSANGGINPVTGAAWAPGDQYRLVFVSSTFRDALSGDVADYNAHVQAAANAAGLGGVTWNAIASTNTQFGGTANVDARDNTGTNFVVDPVGTSIILIDGTTKIADNYTDLWDGDIDARIDRTELNTAYMPPADSPFARFGGVWTGTTGDGQDRGRASLGGSSSDLGLASVFSTPQWVRRSEIMGGGNADPLGLYAISDVLTIPGDDDPVIPEPATATIALLGLGGLMIRRRRNAA